jgi:hypothetical protein
MKLSDLIGPDHTLPIGFDAKTYGLVFDNAICDALLAVQLEDAKNRIAPVELTDGTWVTSADVLTEATDGIFAPIFSQLPTELAEQVAVVDWGDVINLLPKSEPFGATEIK